MVSNSSEPGKAELPGYQEGRGTNGALDTIHSYSLKNSKGMDWLFLRVKSRAPSSATLPSFTTGDPIQGEVEVDVDKAESSKGVVIAVRRSTRNRRIHGMKMSCLACWRMYGNWTRTSPIPQR